MNNIGVIGMGVMGRNIAFNMANHGFKVGIFNRTYRVTQEIMEKHVQNIEGYEHLEDMIASLESPKKVFLMVPAGEVVDYMIDTILPLLSEGDILMDGGNSFFEDTNRRHDKCESYGIHYYGVGVSGGEEGALKGPSIMPGGDIAHYGEIAPILESIAAHKEDDACCCYIGPKGAGHYVKMVHNGIEYADMQLLAEVYLIFKYVNQCTNSEIADILEQWQQRDVSSYLVDITIKVLREKDHATDADLIDVILDVAGNKGTGRWTSIEALRQEYNASLLTSAYQARIMSNQLKLRETFKDVVDTGFTRISSEDVYKAYALSKTLAFMQGFGLYQDASERYGWNLNLEKIASIFRAGCIIQAKLLQEIMSCYASGYASLWDYPRVKERIILNNSALKNVVVAGLNGALALPVFTNAMLYLTQISTGHLGANLIQGQRDYFGAHTYQRVDKEGFEHHDWSNND